MVVGDGRTVRGQEPGVGSRKSEARVPSPEGLVPKPEHVRAGGCAGTMKMGYVPGGNVHKKPQGYAARGLENFARNLRCVRKKVTYDFCPTMLMKKHILNCFRPHRSCQQTHRGIDGCCEKDTQATPRFGTPSINWREHSGSRLQSFHSCTSKMKVHPAICMKTRHGDRMSPSKMVEFSLKSCGNSGARTGVGRPPRSRERSEWKPGEKLQIVVYSLVPLD